MAPSDINDGILLVYKRRVFMAIDFLLKRLAKRRKIIGNRLVEIPFALLNISEKDKKILDVGCAESKLSLQLASMGKNVWGIDIRDYPYSSVSQNFNFVKGDITKTDFSNNFFDCITSISTIEHIGLNAYGGKNILDGDKRAVKEIHRVLKPSGKFILTIPFGKKKINRGVERIYDYASIQDLLNPYFKIVKEVYYINKNEDTILNVSRKEAEKTDHTPRIIDAVALFLCKRI